MEAQEAAVEALERALDDAKARAHSAEQRAAHACSQLKVCAPPLQAPPL